MKKKLTIITFIVAETCIFSNHLVSSEDVNDLSTFSLEELVEIKVTASRTGLKNINETPIAITNFSGESIRFSLSRDIRDLAHFTPSMTISQNVGYAQIYIRGVGSNNVFLGTEPSTALHVDGVYIARPQGQLNRFQNIERIEILRGPQGTLYGRNSTGGTINIVSRSVDLEENESNLTIEGGNYKNVVIGGHINIPLKEDKSGFSLDFTHSNRDAYRKNIIDTGNDIDSENYFGIKGQFRFEGSEGLSLTIRSDFVKDKGVVYGYMTFLEPVSAPLANSILGQFDKVALNRPNDYWRNNGGISLDISKDFPSGWTLNSKTAYRENDFAFDADTDASELDVLQSIFSEDQNQFSEEITLQGSLGKLKSLFGLYYFKETAKMVSEIKLFLLGIQRNPSPEVDTLSKAIFGNLNYPINDKLSINLGARYNWVKMDYVKNDGLYVLDTNTLIADFSFPVQTRKDDVLTPRFSAEYKAADNIFLYASAAKGFKGGGFNFTGASEGSFRPETLWSYEAGIKLNALENKFQINIAGFKYDYKDLQVQSFIVAGSTDISNASNANISGLELEMRALMDDNLILSGNISVLKGEYKNYTRAPISGGGFIDASGNILNNAPKFSGGIVLDYNQIWKSGVVHYRVEYSWQSKIYFTADNNSVELQDRYGLLNGFVEYKFNNKNVSIELWARNILNENYITGSASFSIARTGRAGPPATFGIKLKTEF